MTSVDVAIAVGIGLPSSTRLSVISTWGWDWHSRWERCPARVWAPRSRSAPSQRTLRLAVGGGLLATSVGYAVGQLAAMRGQ